MKNKKRRSIYILSGYSSDGKAALFTLAFTYLYLIAEIVYKFKVNHTVSSWEIVLLFLIFAVFGIAKKVFSSNSLPIDFYGEPLPIGNDKCSKRKRRNYYLIGSLGYALVFSVVTFLSITASSIIHKVNLGAELISEAAPSNTVLGIIAASIMFVVSFILTFMIDYVWYERKASVCRFIQEEEARRAAEEAAKAAEEAAKEEKLKTATKKKNNSEKELATAATVKRRGRPPKNQTENK